MKLKLVFTRLKYWEYWPFEVVYFPLLFYWLYLSAKARSFFYFAAANPGIETGGMLGESKYSILKKIPEEFIPKTLFVPTDTSFKALRNLIDERDLKFPLIAKPDVGERGTKVQRITSEKELVEYLESSAVDFIIQDYIEYPIELGIFYYRFPDKESGEVTSIVSKEYLKVRGDGKSTISELMERYPRAAFQVKRFSVEKKELMNQIPEKEEEVVLEPIGNHCRGTMFLNGNHLIDEALVRVINSISIQIDGFYYGRYDLKCRSLEDLKAGRFIKIMELNGVGAEPAHIYQPGYSLWKAYKTLFSHWKVMFEISQKNHELGCSYMSFKEGMKKYKWIKQYYKKLKA